MSAQSATMNATSVDLSVSVAGVRFANPVIAASGTFGYGSEYSRIIDVSRLGGICSKGLTLAPKPGNTGVRLVETPSGLINSIGLENPGIPHFIEHELMSMLSLGPVVLANLSGSTMETYVEGAALLDATDVPMIELNISCPNVKAGGMAWGLECDAAGAITAAVRKATKKPLVVKLSPNAPHLVDVAKSVVASGADALSLVNTFQSFAVDIERAKPVFDNVTAGLAGPAIRPIALRMLRDVVLGVSECRPDRAGTAGFVPVIGLGGIATWQDAVEFLMTGASAIQVGTATFANPGAMEDIISGLSAFMLRKGYPDLAAMRGLAVR
ncbi:MAG: Dihydroorotate dehydrogenase B (NAD(+)), catalytic subunit [Spirochaetes bacterium ADurb.Bin269]|nr:MAG: Dihydroorotate dehydrogenase B (NAD(+)), catalytic subunit [Spirochaetes bacterium ADurb.Bin269]